MRKEATLKNSIAGLINRIVTMIFAFVVRHYFAKYMLTECLGYEGLFQNVLGLFSLIDMGFGTAIAFDLYKPIHNNEREKISAIMSLFRKIYNIIGVIIFVMSLLFVPFLLYFIKGNTIDGSQIQLYFLIYAFGVTVSYFFSYKRTLLFAMQKNYIVTNVDTIVKILGSLCQLYALVYRKNYFMYLIIIVAMNIVSNLLVSYLSDKGNYYDKKSATKLPTEYKEKLTTHVKTLFITNIAWQGISSTDNIIISAVVGIVDLAKNANYTTIVTAINGIVTSVLGGVSASIGDLIAEGNKEKIKSYFDKYCFIYTIVASYVCLGVFYVSKPVITVWVGENFLFNDLPILLIALNLYFSLIFKPMADYQNYSGNFVYYKPYSIVALFINLIVSIVGAQIIGISGVFIGTTMTYIFMCAVVIRIVYKHVFDMKVFDYYRKMTKINMPLIISAAVLFLIRTFITIGNPIIEIIIMFISVTVVYFASVLIVLRKEQNLVFFKELLFGIIYKVFCKIKTRV